MTWQIVSPPGEAGADFGGFLAKLEKLDSERSWFDRGAELVVARAPGRLDVMGGIADYSGSLVLQLPLAEATYVAVQRRPARDLSILTDGVEASGSAPDFGMPLAAFERGGLPIDYAEATAAFLSTETRQWAAYVAGTLLVLMRERGATFADGARLLIISGVPEGAGVSSSAAVEVASMQAICAAYGLEVKPRELALLCQRVENHVADAACGVMDQVTAACGQANKLLALLCQPAEIEGHVAIQKELSIFGIDSGLRRAISGSSYTSVRVGAFMGYRIMAELAGLDVQAGAPGEPVRIVDPLRRGYLANFNTFEFERQYGPALPEHMAGRSFLDTYQGTTDPVTRVDPEVTYAVRVPTSHPVHEHHRARAFAQILHEPISEEGLLALGELMYASHASTSACGLGSNGTDLLVEMVREAGPESGLYGARITGGGGGGSVAVLGRRGSDPAVEAIAAEYEHRTGRPARVFRGSSPGAAAFGSARLRWEGAC